MVAYPGALSTGAAASEKQRPLGSLFSCHRHPPLPHLVWSSRSCWPRPTGVASAAARTSACPGPGEAIPKYKQPERCHKGAARGARGNPAIWPRFRPPGPEAARPGAVRPGPGSGWPRSAILATSHVADTRRPRCRRHTRHAGPGRAGYSPGNRSVPTGPEPSAAPPRPRPRPVPRGGSAGDDTAHAFAPSRKPEQLTCSAPAPGAATGSNGSGPNDHRPAQDCPGDCRDPVSADRPDLSPASPGRSPRLVAGRTPHPSRERFGMSEARESENSHNCRCRIRSAGR